MTKQEYLDSIHQYPTDEEKTTAISKLYRTRIDGLIAKIISFSDKAGFIEEERRAFSFNEIMNASKDYGKDFISLGVIPFIDAYDNDLIVYVIAEDLWAKYNLSDEVIFKKRADLEEVL